MPSPLEPCPVAPAPRGTDVREPGASDLGAQASLPTRPAIRPSFEQIYMRLAFALAERATCKRLQVGTVLTSVDFRKVLAVGYNGNATGLPNCCDRDEAGNCGCLHSEENAVINCDSPRQIEKIAFVTHMPCAACAKRLINLGNVRCVYYAHRYRSCDAEALLAQVGIELCQLPSW